MICIMSEKQPFFIRFGHKYAYLQAYCIHFVIRSAKPHFYCIFVTVLEKDMKILVTGAAGFIGSKLAYRLAQRGDEVVGLDNINDYYDVRLKLGRLTNAE